MQPTDQTSPRRMQRAISGVVLLLLGAAILTIAWNYPMGRVSDMGPGFVPIMVGTALVLLALPILVVDLTTRFFLAPPRMHWRGLVFVSAAVLVFATLIQPAGLVPAMFAAVAVSKLADPTNRPVSILIYAVATAVAGWGLFLVVLELPIPAFWR